MKELLLSLIWLKIRLWTDKRVLNGADIVNISAQIKKLKKYVDKASQNGYNSYC